MTVLTTGKTTLDYFMRRASLASRVLVLSLSLSLFLFLSHVHFLLQFQTLIKKMESRSKVLLPSGLTLTHPHFANHRSSHPSGTLVSEKLF